MTLTPKRNDVAPPRYPVRQASLFRLGGRWVRRVGALATVVAATSFWTVGCIGIAEGGAIGPTDYWICEDEPNDPVPVSVPGAFSGELCETMTRWADLTVEEQTPVRITFEASSLASPERISADIVDPSGVIVATVAPGAPAELTLTPGEWRVGVASEDPNEGDFTLYIDLAQDR